MTSKIIKVYSLEDFFTFARRVSVPKAFHMQILKSTTPVTYSGSEEKIIIDHAIVFGVLSMSLGDDIVRYKETLYQSPVHNAEREVAQDAANAFEFKVEKLREETNKLLEGTALTTVPGVLLLPGESDP